MIERYKPRMVWNRVRCYWVCYGKGVHGVATDMHYAYIEWETNLRRKGMGA